ncbi:MAG TPA: hypothetical protein VKU85_11160 [bacterium]|nr:hypothetical protein [bacterium]
MLRPLLSARGLVVPALVALLAAGCGTDRALDAGTAADPDPALSPGVDPTFGHIAVANRASGTVSVLDGATGANIDTVTLPGPNPPEPMYVNYIRKTDAVIVGDRANSRVVELDARDFTVRRMAPAGAGVFHQWADASGRRIWVNNDIDNTSTVIDPESFSVITTVPMPTDLTGMGAKPHDVILDPRGLRAFVTMLTLGAEDYVVQFDTRTFQETGRAAVGKDPHVSLTRRSDLLYVPAQNGNVVHVLDQATLTEVTSLAVPGAHGAGMTQSGRVFYTTNLPGGGTDALFAIHTGTNTLIGNPVDTPYAAPHNIALTANGLRLFVTHSGGTSDKVTFYSISAEDPTPVLLGEATVGLNPFGITFVP